MKIYLKINYFLSRKIIIHTSMLINKKWAEVKGGGGGGGGVLLFYFIF